MSTRYHDSHVRARAKLMRRIIDRMQDWGMYSTLARRQEMAARKLADYTWDGHEWTVFERQRLRQTKDVAAHAVHSIMCRWVG